MAVPLKPNAVAGRAYFRIPAALAESLRYLCIAYDRSLCPGYGWIFPGPDRCLNLGVGYFSASGALPSLKHLWALFTTRFAAAAAVLRVNQNPISRYELSPTSSHPRKSMP